MAWAHFNDLITTGPDLVIQDPVLLQHFYMGLSKDSMESLNAASRGAFLLLPTSEARSILDKISGKTPYNSNHNKLPDKEKKSSPDQEEEVLIAKAQPLQSQDLVINPKPPIPQIPQEKKEFHLWKSLLKLRMTSLVLILGEH